MGAPSQGSRAGCSPKLAVTVAELAEHTRDLLIEMGIQPDTVWTHYLRITVCQCKKVIAGK